MIETEPQTDDSYKPRPGEEMERGGSPGHLFTKDTAAEMGRRGGQKGGRHPKKKTLAWLKDHKDQLYDRLYEASFGLGAFAELPADKQLAALKLLLERVEGRPTQKKDDEPDSDEGWSIEERAEE